MRYSTGLLLVFSAGLLWSTMGVVLRHVDSGPWAALFWRSVGTVAFLAVLLQWRQGLWPALRAAGWPGVVGGLCLVPAFAGAVYAYQATTIANAAFLFAAAPVLAAALGWLALREAVRMSTWVAMAMAALGIFVMVRQGLGTGALVGNLAAIGSAMGFAAFSVCLRWGRTAAMVPAILTGSLLCMLAGAAGAAATGASLAIGGGSIALAMALGALVVGGGLVLYTLGARVLTAAELTLLSTVEVMLAPVWAWMILSEAVSPATFLGGAILMAGVLFNGLSGARREMRAASRPGGLQRPSRM